MKKLNISICALLIFTSLSTIARADLSKYTLNIYNSLALSGSRCTGMGGAVVSLGDDADDIFYNCASSSVRNKFQKDNFEWDYSLSFANILSKNNIDYRNASQVFPNYETDNISYTSVAVMALYKRWSLSVTFGVSSIDLDISGATYTLQETLITVNLAHELIAKRLFVAIGVVVPTLTFLDGDDEELVNYDYGEDVAPNFQLGAIYVFKDIPLRLGVNAKLNNNATVATNTTAAVIALPKDIRSPSSITIGASWKFNLNNSHSSFTNGLPQKITGKKIKQRRFSLTPDYLLIAANLTYVGTVDNAVDILSYTGGTTAYRSGEKTMLEPKFGVELSFPTWLKIRAGYYYEGPRISGTTGRHHITLNTEFGLLYLFGMDIATSFTMDWSREYWSAGFSVKIWKY